MTEEPYNSNLESIKRFLKLDYLHCISCGDLYPHLKNCYQKVKQPPNKKGLLSFMPSVERVIKFYHLKFDWGHSGRVFSVILPPPLLIGDYYIRIDDDSLKELLIDKIKESFKMTENSTHTDTSTKNN